VDIGVSSDSDSIETEEWWPWGRKKSPARKKKPSAAKEKPPVVDIGVSADSDVVEIEETPPAVQAKPPSVDVGVLSDSDSVEREKGPQAVKDKSSAVKEKPRAVDVGVLSDSDSVEREKGPRAVKDKSSAVKEKPPAAVDKPKSVPKGKREFLKTVKAIHGFFQGDYSMQVILQAIHACAGDYRSAVVKLTQGFGGAPILEIPPTGPGKASAEAVRRYLRGQQI
jgi:hypothetical protein